MIGRVSIYAAMLALLLIVFCVAPVRAMEKCIICHGKRDLVKTEETGRQISLFVDQEKLAVSVHQARECTECHVDIVEIPHQKAKKVNCGRCHYSGNPIGAPESEIYDQYQHSVHGRAIIQGNAMAPVCQDCHGTHEIMAPDSSSSRVHKQNIPKTCGTCHIDIYSTYQESVHGQALIGGVEDAPTCASCHGEHNIRRHEDPTSSVASTNVSHTCATCHGPVGVVAKYGIKTDRVLTFEESFHGVAQVMDNAMVANCASCHGVHDIRTHDDPKSSIHVDNIQKTCGKEGCHPEASAQFASGQIHVDPTSEESGILYYITKFFTILTVSTLAGLLIFILLDLFRRAKSAREKR
jgi:DnaJ-class molecular chaperone